MSRISREALYIQIASLVAKRSTCNRMSVGSVITHKNRVISTGYNGPAKDMPHCNEIQCNENKPCTKAIHAEINALRGIPVDIIGSDHIIIYCTHQPCFNCALAIVGYEIPIVYYLHPYRNNQGLLLLIEKGIKVIQINEQGETINQS